MWATMHSVSLNGPRVPPAVFVTAVCLMLFPGCVNSDVNWGSPIESVPSPSWAIGQWWLYTGSDGFTYLQIVEAREEKNGVEAYRVRESLSGANDAGQSSYVLWFDARHKGFVAAEMESVWVKTKCNSGQFVPLRNEQLICTTSMTHYPEETYRYEKTIIGWTNVSTSRGVFPAVEIELREIGSTERDARRISYVPAAEILHTTNTVTSRTLTLQDWGDQNPPTLTRPQ